MGKLATFGLSFFGIVYVSGKYAFPAPGGGGGGLWPERRRKELLLKPQVDNPGLKKGGPLFLIHFFPFFKIFFHFLSFFNLLFPFFFYHFFHFVSIFYHY